MITDDTHGDGSHTIQPPSGELVVSAPIATVWLTYSFAKDWYTDAVAEATRPMDSHDAQQQHRNAVRREIMFAVCAAESYLVEWVRDGALHGDFVALNRYFPPGVQRGLTEKWKDVPRALVQAGLLAAVPQFDGRHGTEWRKLVDYRNGLVHARTARPDTGGLPPDEKPVPDFYVLNALARGWACHVVAERIEALHRACGTAPPAWLVRPALLAPPGP
jgi:hypothetical protein